MNEYFQHLFEYNDWANEKTIESILTLNKNNERAIELFSHILIAQTVWLDRILTNNPRYTSTWEIIEAGNLNNFSKQSTNEWISLITDLTEEKANSIIIYKNTKGIPYQNRVKDILIHVVNHATYHRGQVAAVVRKENGTPAVTDYIAYIR